MPSAGDMTDVVIRIPARTNAGDTNDYYIKNR